MKVAALVSGGVDSSVALTMLKEQGHDVTAFYLKIWLEDELAYLGSCPWEEDLGYVRALCEQLDVPLKVVNLQKEYKDHIIAYTINEVKQGRTPNPDILCNNRIKFGAFLDYIDDSFDKIATGHYAQVQECDGQYLLKKAPDPIKDQTYFLSYLSQDQLKRIIFPIGHLDKSQVRQLAHDYQLPTRARKDSQGLCFLGKIKFEDFLRHHLGTQVGDLIEYETGAKLGEHQGFWYHTIGQRKGSGLSGGPWYVVAKDPAKNIVYVSCTYHAADKVRNSCIVSDLHWITEQPTKQDLQVKVRHGAHAHDSSIEYNDDGSIQVTFNDRDQGLAPGQFAAFYDGEYCLGSGVMHS